MADKELDAVPRITLDRDDIAERRASSIQRPSAEPARKGGGASMSGQNLTTAIVLVAVVALAGILFLYMQLMKSQQALQAATVRIEQLEGRLNSTDTSMTQSEVLLSAKLKSMDEATEANKVEIRRVSGIADKHTKSLDALTAASRSQDGAIKEMQPSLQQTATQLTATSSLLKSVESLSKETAQRVELVQENLHDVEGDTKVLKDKQGKLEGDMVKRVTTLEDTAKSTDVFRRNTQDELRRLREELVKTSGAPPASPAK